MARRRAHAELGHARLVHEVLASLVALGLYVRVGEAGGVDAENPFSSVSFFFFKAEDGIRDSSVTGVQTCALPIYRRLRTSSRSRCLAVTKCKSGWEAAAAARCSKPSIRRSIAVWPCGFRISRLTMRDRKSVV